MMMVVLDIYQRLPLYLNTTQSANTVVKARKLACGSVIGEERWMGGEIIGVDQLRFRQKHINVEDELFQEEIPPMGSPPMMQ